MKKSTVAQKMRWAAGVLYLALGIYQMLAMNAVLLGGSLYNSSFVWLAALAVIPAAGCMGVWMFYGDSVFSAGVRRAVVVATGWFVVFELITYGEQTKLINATFSQRLPQLFDQQIWLYFFMIFRLLLMILAAFFVTSCRDSMDYVSGSKKADAAEDGMAAKPASTSPDLDKPLAVPKKDDAKAANDLDKPLKPMAPAEKKEEK